MRGAQRRHRRGAGCGVRGAPATHRVQEPRHIYAQIVNDDEGRTLVAASTLSKDLPQPADRVKKVELAKAVGTLVADRALAAQIQAVVFDRGGYPFHGRVKALASAAGDWGLKF
jgi:large subunit ribosomal protein L18